MHAAELKKNAKAIVQQLYHTIEAVDLDSSSLLGGDAGVILFLQNYGEHFGTDTSEIIASKIENFFSRPFSGYTFCNGAAGLNWLYQHLANVSLLDEDDLKNLCTDEKLLMMYVENELKRGNYDFLHGAIGVCYTMLHAYNERYHSFFLSCFHLLSKLADNDTKMFYDYDFVDEKHKPGVVNLGLAHGIPAILKFCIACFKNNVCPIEAKALAFDIISYLMRHQNRAGVGSYYPNIISNTENDCPSRLAWCYGDLGIGYVLYQTGIAFQEKNIVNFALQMLTQTTLRKKTEDTRVFDGGICHGSAGIAHIYNRMWHYTSDPVFKDARDYWLEKTLDFAVYENENIAYRQFISKTNKYEVNYNLLEGTVGIGLVLLSYLSHDFSWDYCVMLND